MDYFAAEKARALGQVDLSRKGAIDEPIVPLIQHINSLGCYYTTSSCSGRVSIYCQDGKKRRKKGCQWVLVSHELVEQAQIYVALESSCLPLDGYVFFKFEPFVLHVMCRTLQDAQNMLHIAVSSGFRNSGITVGKKGRFMLAVRSTHSLEAPVAYKGQIIATQEYMKHLVDVANTKLSENQQRVERFFKLLKDTSSHMREGTKTDRREKPVGVRIAGGYEPPPSRKPPSLEVASNDSLLTDEQSLLWLFEGIG